MNKDKLKVIVKNLEILIQSLKSEIYSDVDFYNQDVPEKIFNRVVDYDEIFEDDDD
jgi:hypothetical protein